MRYHTTLGPIRFKAFGVSFLLLGLALAMRIASTPTANLSYLVIAGYALAGRTHAIQALAASWFFTMISPGIAPPATASSMGRYAVIFAAALSVLSRSELFRDGIRIQLATFVTLVLGGFFIVHAFFFSPMIDVSLLKAVSWTLTMTTLISAWSGLRADEREILSQQIFAGLIVLMLVSFPLIAIPLGYLTNGTGFQGVLNQPQAFGPTMALLGAWAASRLFSSPRPSWWTFVVLGTCLAMIVLSEARTAGLALVLGIFLAVLTAPALSGRSVKDVLPGLRSRRLLLAGTIMLIVSTLAAPKLADIAASYLSKSGRASITDLVDAYKNSRGILMDPMWENIEVDPFFGIGFGIASQADEMEVTRDPLLGLPTGAAVEKGVLPLAVWEEVGLIGSIGVIAWILMLLSRGARGGVTPLAVAITTLLLNLGESTLFSPGGLGLISLVLIGWIFSAGQTKGTLR